MRPAAAPVTDDRDDASRAGPDRVRVLTRPIEPAVLAPDHAGRGDFNSVHVTLLIVLRRHYVKERVVRGSRCPKPGGTRRDRGGATAAPARTRSARRRRDIRPRRADA